MKFSFRAWLSDLTDREEGKNEDGAKEAAHQPL